LVAWRLATRLPPEWRRVDSPVAGGLTQRPRRDHQERDREDRRVEGKAACCLEIRPVQSNTSGTLRLARTIAPIRTAAIHPGDACSVISALATTSPYPNGNQRHERDQSVSATTADDQDGNPSQDGQHHQGMENRKRGVHVSAARAPTGVTESMAGA